MQQYMSQMRAMFNKHALYSDESPQYQIPFEPNPGDTVKIRFRTLKNNVDAVYFISGSTRAQMQVGLVRNGFDYYEIEIPVGNEPIRYFFEIQAGRVVCYYNKLGVTRELQEMYSFGIIPGFHTPDWAKGAVMYQIFVDRFCNGDPSNDVLTGEYSYIGEQVNKVDDWNRFPEQMDVRNFYGGDLQGVIDKMDYLVSDPGAWQFIRIRCLFRRRTISMIFRIMTILIRISERLSPTKAICSGRATRTIRGQRGILTV